MCKGVHICGGIHECGGQNLPWLLSTSFFGQSLHGTQSSRLQLVCLASSLWIPWLLLPATGIVKTPTQHLSDFWRPSIDCSKQHKLYLLGYFFPFPCLSVCLSILMMLDMNTGPPARQVLHHRATPQSTSAFAVVLCVCLPAHMCTMCVPWRPGGPSSPLELKLRKFESSHVGVVNGSWALCKSSKHY